MNWSIVIENWKVLASGLAVTLMLLFSSALIGFFLSLPLAALRDSPRSWISLPVRAFTFTIRGTPALVQFFLIYYGLSQFEQLRAGFLWPLLSNATFCALLALVASTTAYTSEILAGALRAIPTGQIEAAASLGMSAPLTYRRITLPLILRHSLPQYGSELILLMHSTSLASTITLLDLTGAARYLNAQYYTTFEPLLTVAALYLLIAMLLSQLIRFCERKWRDPIL